MTAAVQAQALVKRYGERTVVDHIDLTVPDGALFVLVGPNGAGKTTTLEMLQGVRRPTSGRIEVLGLDLARHRDDLLPRIGVLPQQAALPGLLTVREMVEYYGGFYPWKADTDAVLASLGLEAERDRRASDLSGGLVRRLAIATCVSHEPDLLFLDEPTANIDPVGRRQIWEMIQALRNEGTTVILTTHYMDEAQRLGDTVAFIREGRILAEGHPTDLIRRHGPGRTLTVGPLPPEQAQRLSSLFPAATVAANGQASIPLASADDAASVLGKLTSAGVDAIRVAIREPSLDDVFYALASKGTEATA